MPIIVDNETSTLVMIATKGFHPDPTIEKELAQDMGLLLAEKFHKIRKGTGLKKLIRVYLDDTAGAWFVELEPNQIVFENIEWVAPSEADLKRLEHRFARDGQPLNKVTLRIPKTGEDS